MSDMVVNANAAFVVASDFTPARERRRGLELSVEECVAAAILVFYGTAAYIPVLMPNTESAVTENSQVSQVHTVNHVMFVLIWMSVALLIAKSWNHIRLRSWPAVLSLTFSFFAVASILWSGARAATLSAGLGMVFLTAFGIYLVDRFSRRRLSVILLSVFMFLALSSAFFALLVPSYGLDHFGHAGAWQGVFAQKNGLGNVMVYGTAVAIAFRAESFLEQIYKIVLLLAALAEVFLSQSREAWIAAAVVIMLYFTVELLSKFAVADRKILSGVCCCAAVILCGLAISYGTELLEALNRDATLTGRTDIWRAVEEQYHGHWVLGYGLGGFWGSPHADRVYALLRWRPSSAHNGFLETQLELGIIGLALLLLIFALAWRDAWRGLKNCMSELSPLSYILICVLPMLNVVAFAVPYPNSITWPLLIISASVLRQNVTAKRGRPGAIRFRIS